MEEKYRELSQRVGLGGALRAPKLFAMLADEREADLLLALPADVPALAQKTGRPQAEVQAAVELLFHKGLVFKSFKTEPISYRMCNNPVQFHDATILWPEAPREFLDLWQEFQETEILELQKAFAEVAPRPVMRVIPVGVTMEVKNKVLAHEDVKEIIEAAEILAVTKCTCKLTAHKCDTTLECCLQLNNSARYALARGTGRELTKPEAIELMKKLELEGLIHTVNNLKSVKQVICNCCSCCCQNFPGFIHHNINSVDPSRFTAAIDAELCVGCETCLGRCFFGAIAMVEEDGRTTAQISNPAKCMGCGLCQVVCPSEAITLRETRDRDFIPDSWSVTH
ncbi:MAG: 4Fe-4S dicluster domain-containing protein [Pseudomonadota bacterium]